MNTTPWYQPSIRPEHTGIYQRLAPGFKCVFSRWNGIDWELPTENHTALRYCVRQDLPWRGLTTTAHLCGIVQPLTQRQLQEVEQLLLTPAERRGIFRRTAK